MQFTWVSLLLFFIVAVESLFLPIHVPNITLEQHEQYRRNPSTDINAGPLNQLTGVRNYLVEVVFDNQIMLLVPDTGSYELVVNSVNCKTTAGAVCSSATGGFNIMLTYNSAAIPCGLGCPSCDSELRCYALLQYGAMDIAGYMATGPVTFAGTNIGLGVSYIIGMQQKINGPSFGLNDGILGLGYAPTYSARTGSNLVTRITAMAALPNIFSIDLTFDGGQLFLGGVNPLFAPSTLIGQVPALTSTAQWGMRIEYFMVGASIVANIPVTGIIDTGYTFLGLPSQIYSSVVSGIRQHCNLANSRLTCGSTTIFTNTQQCLYFSGQDLVNMPNIFLAMKSTSNTMMFVSIPPNQYIDYRLTDPAIDSTTLPYCGASKLQNAGSAMSLGTPFYRSVSVVHYPTTNIPQMAFYRNLKAIVTKPITNLPTKPPSTPTPPPTPRPTTSPVVYENSPCGCENCVTVDLANNKYHWWKVFCAAGGCRVRVQASTARDSKLNGTVPYPSYSISTMSRDNFLKYLANMNDPSIVFNGNLTFPTTNGCSDMSANLEEGNYYVSVKCESGLCPHTNLGIDAQNINSTAKTFMCGTPNCGAGNICCGDANGNYQCAYDCGNLMCCISPYICSGSQCVLPPKNKSDATSAIFNYSLIIFMLLIALWN